MNDNGDSDAPLESYSLRLFITGMTPRSVRAIENVRHICESRLKNRYELQVIDIYQHPVRARDEQIIASPTLIKERPLPRRRMIGDLSSEDRLLNGLDLMPA
jgi:circadian clock protein KaiB